MISLWSPVFHSFWPSQLVTTGNMHSRGEPPSIHIMPIMRLFHSTECANAMKSRLLVLKSRAALNVPLKCIYVVWLSRWLFFFGSPRFSTTKVVAIKSSSSAREKDKALSKSGLLYCPPLPTFWFPGKSVLFCVNIQPWSPPTSSDAFVLFCVCVCVLWGRRSLVKHNEH